MSTFFRESIENWSKTEKQSGIHHARKALWHNGYRENVTKRRKGRKNEKGMGNNPMVGATVAVAVAVEEAVK